MSLSLPKWTPSSTPSSTTLSSVATSHSSALHKSLTSALAKGQTATAKADVVSLSQVIRGAQASLTIINAEGVLATATGESTKSQATEGIFEATLNLKSLYNEMNLFGENLNYAANIIYLVVFSAIFLYFILMPIKSRYIWFNITFFFGYGLEFVGFLGRVLALGGNETTETYFLMQIVTLTIAPAFIMAGIYFLFAQLVVIHGRQFSLLKPMWYSYFFIVCDVVSLIIQAAGGGTASVASNLDENSEPGTHTMIAGIAFQVFSMSVFLLFWFEFLIRMYFKDNDVNDENKLSKKSLSSFIRLLLNLPSTREYKNILDEKYNPQYKEVRKRKLFRYYPFAITCAVLFVYIRSIYRVVELAQGFSGYLMTHEVYLMVLDAMMICFAGFTFVPFHPFWVFRGTVIKASDIRRNRDENLDEKLYEKSDEMDANSDANSDVNSDANFAGSPVDNDSGVNDSYSIRGKSPSRSYS